MPQELKSISLIGTIIICLLALMHFNTCYCSDQDIVNINFWHAMKGQKKEIFDELLKKFHNENPAIKVNEIAIASADEKMGNDYNALYMKLLESLAQNTPPDVAQVYENWTTQFIDIKAIIPIDTFKDGPDALTEKDKKDFFPVFIEANTFDGKLWTIPFNKSMYVLFYNKAIFEKYSLCYPKTWDELRETAKRLTIMEGDKVSLYGLVYAPSVDMFGLWLYSYGGEFIKDDAVRFGDPTGIKDLEFWVKLTNEDKAALPSFNAFQDFESQKAAMYLETTSKIGILKRSCPFKYGIAPIPEGSVRSYPFAGTNLAIFSKSTDEKRAAAWKFVRFLSNTDNTAFWAINTGYLPVRQSAVNSSNYKEFLKSHPDYVIGVQSLQYAKIQPRSPAWESIRGFINDAIYEAISQASSPQEALEKAVSYSNELLKGFKGQK